ncbi:hypothetical protein [Carboxylicivirga sp. N1Y90]|uniref:hypothetical protein n=1 Tax=Carboxylicivirga fragile TaxID=3417571 RepID=UPI003D32E871|nr:hypothetical protein [Marinilabiliaceae bacterium N1Y90]
MNKDIKLFKASLKDMMKLFLFNFIIISSFFFLITIVIMDKSFDELSLSTLLYLLIYPIIIGLTQSFVNRNGVITIENKDGIVSERKIIESLLDEMNYEKNFNDNTSTQYSQKSRLKKLFNLLIDERLRVTYEKDTIIVLSRKRILERLETGLIPFTNQNAP